MMSWKFPVDYHEISNNFYTIQTKVWRNVSQLWGLRNVRRKLVLLPVCLLGFFFVYSWTIQSNSCALYAFMGLILFDIFTLIGDILNHWCTQTGKPSTAFSFGFVRVEVLIHFTVLCFGILLNIFATLVLCGFFVEGFRIRNDDVSSGDAIEDEIHLGRFLPTAAVGGLIHFLLSFNNNSLIRVYKISCTYTSLQKYFQGICSSFGLSLDTSSSVFAHSPIAILGLFSVSTVGVLAFALQSGPTWIDVVGGALIIFGIFDTICPLCLYTGQVLLQTVPSHVGTQLEKALREALTIDGVLEFRNELFWTLSYGQIAGTLHVRVRRDANEQLVLSKVYEKLQPLAPHLTIQITKDDMLGRTFGSSLQILPSPPLPTHHMHYQPPHQQLFHSFVTIPNTTSSNTNEEPFSPIPPAYGHNNHLIYSTASVNSMNMKPVIIPSSSSPLEDHDTVNLNISGSSSNSISNHHSTDFGLTTSNSNSRFQAPVPVVVSQDPVRGALIRGPSTHITVPENSHLNHANALISSTNYFSKQ